MPVVNVEGVEEVVDVVLLGVVVEVAVVVVALRLVLVVWVLVVVYKC